MQAMVETGTFIQAEKTAAMVEVIEQDNFARQDQGSLSFLRGKDSGQSWFKNPAHIVPQVPAQASGHGRKLTQIFWGGNSQMVETGLKTLNIILVAEIFKMVQAWIKAVYLKKALDAGQDQTKIPAKKTVATQAAIYFATFQKKGVFVFNEGQVEGNRGLGICWKPASVLGNGDHRLSVDFRFNG